MKPTTHPHGPTAPNTPPLLHVLPRSGAPPIASRNGPSPLRYSSTSSSDQDTHRERSPNQRSTPSVLSKRSYDEATSFSQSQLQSPLKAMDNSPFPTQPYQPNASQPPREVILAPSPSPDGENALGAEPNLRGQQSDHVETPPDALDEDYVPPDVDEPPPTKNSRTGGAKKGESATRSATGERVHGSTLLPLARVQKIMRADKELSNTSKEAVFLVSCATEAFVQRFARSINQQAHRESRLTIQQKDLASVVHRSPEYSFLQEIIPLPMPASLAVAKRQEKEAKKNAMPANAPIVKAFGSKATTSVSSKGKGKAKSNTSKDKTDADTNGYMNGTSLADVPMDAVVSSAAGQIYSASPTDKMAVDHSAGHTDDADSDMDAT
ncbi:hypothetical protein FRB99_006636 [Tulasnella sp. 403]|nr:hypothetical protein FRB99_006636 [Tulasnella sp. 403]